MLQLKPFKDLYTEEEIMGILGESVTDLTSEMDFEGFLRVSNFMHFAS